MASDVEQRIAELRSEGLSMGKIADALNEQGVPTAKGGQWHASTVAMVLRSCRRVRPAFLAHLPPRDLLTIWGRCGTRLLRIRAR
jgi:orotate phosphoribosyltransferase-like protein